ncbi:Hypp7359 [Branchiostoma lanceolatum]|uniref:Hypp7359 protein n=1 Tax=Branchiostoma lanceolatum TaxID=7740 RepID=A0A8J9YZL5_BRALA|nr:Hypp7359 [Branchiostoma lanceolatum]
MAFFGAFLWILAALGMFYPLAEGSVNLYLSGDEVKKLLGMALALTNQGSGLASFSLAATVSQEITNLEFRTFA